MILQALHELAEVEQLVGDPDFEFKPITYLIDLAPGVDYPTIRSTESIPPSEQSKKKPKARAALFQVPREKVRTSGARAFFLFDKAEYVFGVDPDEKRPPGQLVERAALFRQKVSDCAGATGDEAVRALLHYLERVAEDPARVDMPEELVSNALFAFTWSADEGQLLTDRPAVREHWRRMRAEEIAEVEQQICLVTGEQAVPAQLHPQIKPVPGASSSGVPYVSFNSAAFESYGWKNNENASISQTAAESYAAALARLVSPRPTDGEGRAATRQNVRLSADTLACFWTPGDPFGAMFLNLLEPDPGEVAETYRSIWRGKAPPPLERDATFYALVLTGSQGRVITRGCLRATAAEVAEHVALWFRELDLVRLTPPPKKTGHPPAQALSRLLASVAAQGKADQVPAALGQALVEAILADRPLPLSALQRALVRERAEATRDGWADMDRRDSRRALIKAVLERRRRHGQNLIDYPELHPMLDLDNTEPGYLLGRLMAALERLQQTALGLRNASVVDRYFGAASATPRAVFVRLLKNARHHARKAKDDPSTRGYAFHLERLIDELTSGFEPKTKGFPAHLALEQQGLFVLGYHQQRHALFTKKTDSNHEATSADPAD